VTLYPICLMWAYFNSVHIFKRLFISYSHFLITLKFFTLSIINVVCQTTYSSILFHTILITQTLYLIPSTLNSIDHFMYGNVSLYLSPFTISLLSIPFSAPILRMNRKRRNTHLGKKTKPVLRFSVTSRVATYYSIPSETNSFC
jgi:hypothetical protein